MAYITGVYTRFPSTDLTTGSIFICPETESITFAGIHLYTWVVRGTVRVGSDPRTQHNVPGQDSNPDYSIPRTLYHKAPCLDYELMYHNVWQRSSAVDAGFHIWSPRWHENDFSPNAAIVAEMDFSPIGLQRSYRNHFPEIVVIVTKINTCYTRLQRGFVWFRSPQKFFIL